MKITAASAAASKRIVWFWRRRNASAPALIASEILRISSVPVSLAITQPVSQNATASASSEIPMTSRKGNFIEEKKSIRASEGGSRAGDYAVFRGGSSRKRQ